MMLESVDPSINGTTETILKILYVVPKNIKGAKPLQSWNVKREEVIRLPEYCRKIGWQKINLKYKWVYQNLTIGEKNHFCIVL